MRPITRKVMALEATVTKQGAEGFLRQLETLDEATVDELMHALNKRYVALAHKHWMPYTPEAWQDITDVITSTRVTRCRLCQGQLRQLWQVPDAVGPSFDEQHACYRALWAQQCEECSDEWAAHDPWPDFPGAYSAMR